jgi:aerobic carbon-monoxide dehydrogenase small subunit
MISLTVNKTQHTLECPPQTLLASLLREQLGLTGTHIGCDTAQCGACTVVVDGKAVKSCNVLALQVANCCVETVEGLRSTAPHTDHWHPIQLAFSKHHALQCGFCTPGMMMRCVAMANEAVAATPGDIAAALAGNLCRCTGYEGIVQAACESLPIMREQATLSQAMQP